METFSVTLVPGGASVPALGLIPTTVPSGSGASTSRRTGVKPASRSAAAASSNDRPITFGSPVCCWPLRDVEADVAALDDARPALGILRDHGSLGLVGEDVHDPRDEAGRRNVATASDSRAPTTSGTCTLGFPVETK